MRNPVFGFLTRSDTNQAVQPQKMASGLKFRIKAVAGLGNLCNKNKGAHQMHGYHAADQRLCFRMCKKQDFAWLTSYTCNNYKDPIETHFHVVKFRFIGTEREYFCSET